MFGRGARITGGEGLIGRRPAGVHRSPAARTLDGSRRAPVDPGQARGLARGALSHLHSSSGPAVGEAGPCAVDRACARGAPAAVRRKGRVPS
jgi:hypothetical protein